LKDFKMQIAKKIITIAALLGVAIQAAPAARLAKRDTSINVVAGGVLFAQTEQALVSECGGSSFEGVTSGGSPTVGDCLQIARNIAGGGSWSTIADGNWRQLVQSGTWYVRLQPPFVISGFLVPGCVAPRTTSSFQAAP
jgi:hypothetical protein